MKPVSIPKDRWQQIKRLYQEASDRPPAERPEFLEAACGGDESLRVEVESLLEEAAADPFFLELPAPGSPAEGSEEAPESVTVTSLAAEGAAERLPVARVGPYRLLRRIAGGGMGAVYLGVRDDDEFKRRVAIKMLRVEEPSAQSRWGSREPIGDGGGAPSQARKLGPNDMHEELPATAQRFRQERQILAGLDHENVAKLLDGGTTEEGRPYLVMEYVEGMPIDEFCDERRLTVRERLQLFRTVCGAVSFAHRNLIVHRDLKPGNMLVTAEGVPKLLAFGIAKLLNPDPAFQTMDPTRSELRLMTPDYASPEQARGESITTASDVYSLGVVLYELLTGHRPYRFASRSLQEITEVICSREPKRPSTVIAQVERSEKSEESVTPEAVAKTREGHPKTLRRKLAGDLDNIVMMALRKEPQRRYASGEQLSEDIRRHLEGVPVAARPSTFVYRTGKFLKRHKGATAATLLVALTLIGGILGTTWEWRRAERERERAERRFAEVRALANALLFEIHDAVASLPGALPVRELLVKRALEHLDRLTSESAGDPSLRRELADAYRKVGDLQGNPVNPSLGDAAGALKSYRIAQSMLAELAEPAVHSRRGWDPVAFMKWRPNDTGKTTGSDAASIRRSQALVEKTIGDVLSQSGSVSEALDAYRKSVALTDAALALTPDDREAATLKFRSLLGLGDLHFRSGRVDDAARSYDEARTAGAPLDARGEAVLGDRVAAIEEARGNYRQAADGHLQNAALFESILEKEPSNVQALRGRAVSYEKAAGALVKAGDAAAGLENYRRAAELQEATLAADPENAQTRADVARVLTLQASHELAAGRWGDARRLTARALTLAKANADRPGASAFDFNAYAYALLICRPEDMRQPAVALTYATKAVEMTQSTNHYLLGTLALAHFQRGDVPRAIEIQEKAVALIPPEATDLRRAGEETLALFRSKAPQ